eukprot:1157568-Pelagomonas_calceolata.AAC.7
MDPLGAAAPDAPLRLAQAAHWSVVAPGPCSLWRASPAGAAAAATSGGVGPVAFALDGDPPANKLWPECCGRALSNMAPAASAIQLMMACSWSGTEGHRGLVKCREACKRVLSASACKKSLAAGVSARGTHERTGRRRVVMCVRGSYPASSCARRKEATYPCGGRWKAS